VFPVYCKILIISLLQAVHMCLAFVCFVFILCLFQVIYINSTQFFCMVLSYVPAGITKCIKWVLQEGCVYPSTYLISKATLWNLIKFCICTVLKNLLITFHFGLYWSHIVLHTAVTLTCESHNSSVVQMKFSLLVWYVTPCSLIDRGNYSRGTFCPPP
jgi:hypothetical protein